MVETAKGPHAVRVPEWYKPPRDLATRKWPFADPYLAAIVRLAPRKSQVVVSRWHGASVAEISLYGIVRGKLVALGFEPHRYRNELSLFGTVGTGVTNVRCGRHGVLSVLGEGPVDATGKRSFAKRSLYRLAGRTLRLDRTQRMVSSSARADAQARRWGIDALPFTGCSVRRGKSL